jgi:hypothetical protein
VLDLRSVWGYYGKEIYRDHLTRTSSCHPLRKLHFELLSNEGTHCVKSQHLPSEWSREESRGGPRVKRHSMTAESVVKARGFG